MNPKIELVFEVPFHDVDMLRIAWHGHYYKYFELARTELFRKYHCDVDDLNKLGYYLPITDSSCRYMSPLVYGMKVRATATLKEWEYRFVVNYLLSDVESGKKLAKGATTQVSVLAKSNTLCMVTPQVLVEKFWPTTHAEASRPHATEDS